MLNKKERKGKTGGRERENRRERKEKRKTRIQ